MHESGWEIFLELVKLASISTWKEKLLQMLQNKRGNLEGRDCSIRKFSGKMLRIFDYEFFFRVSFQVNKNND